MSVFGPSGSTPGAQAASGDLQFDRAEYQSAGTGLQCSTCHAPAAPEYHELNSKVFCTSCRQRIEASLGRMRENGNVPRALLYGSGAAVAGCLLFYAVSALTGFQFGLIAIAVGYLVGKAVRKGSGSLGGRKYQVMAVLLTYISIASTNLPAITKIFSEKAQKMEQMTATAGSTVNPGVPANRTRAAFANSPRFYIFAFVLALALPFLGGTKNILGLVIIGIALWEAWKFTRAVKVEFKGPFTVAAAPAGNA